MAEPSSDLPPVVPVFPLPGVVLFPHLVLPLHLFEQRYRQLAADAIEGPGLIAMALLKSGFEPLYYTQCAPIHPILCLGRILASERLADGNYNLLLRGVIRARVLEEIREPPYRRARVEPLRPSEIVDAETAAQLRRDLQGALSQDGVFDPRQKCRWRLLWESGASLESITDQLSAELPLGAEFQQALLSEPGGAQRAQMLIECINTLIRIRSARHTMHCGGYVQQN